MKNTTKKIMCGNVQIGGGAAISIQSMTNTDTRNIKETCAQINALEAEGCQIVRVAVPNIESAESILHIKKYVNLPIVADIHFDYRLAIKAIENGADKIRINPGNIGSDERLLAVVKAAKARKIPIRIGVNAGSLEKDILLKYGGVTAQGLAESAINNVARVENMDFNDIVVSIKASNVKMNYDAHIIAKDNIQYPFHIGITESGTINSGRIKSAVGLGALILAGIGDTMRVSLTGDPVREIIVAKEILKAAGSRNDGINIVSCPTCGRCSVNLEPIALEVEERLKKINKNYTIAVMGCEVNGPGEAKEADYGMAFGKGNATIFAKGKTITTVKAEEAVETLLKVIE